MILLNEKKTILCDLWINYFSFFFSFISTDIKIKKHFKKILLVLIQNAQHSINEFTYFLDKLHAILKLCF